VHTDGPPTVVLPTINATHGLAGSWGPPRPLEIRGRALNFA
jgi:hypothetical protein